MYFLPMERGKSKVKARRATSMPVSGKQSRRTKGHSQQVDRPACNPWEEMANPRARHVRDDSHSRSAQEEPCGETDRPGCWEGCAAARAVRFLSVSTRVKSTHVFINCPFDTGYQPIFSAIVFAVYDLGFVARCSLEATCPGGRVHTGEELGVHAAVRGRL